MTFNWKDYLTFAENIKASPENPGPKEATLRSAASRAYYAAFHATLDLGKILGYTPTNTGSDHLDVRKYLLNIKPPLAEAKKITTKLNRLYDFRRQADYHCNLKSSSESLAAFAISNAKDILTLINSLKNVGRKN